MLEDARRQSGHTGRTISDETLLLFASTAMLTSERFMRDNDNWEECTEWDNTWAQWKAAYMKDHTKARVKAKASDGTAKFGAANSDACQDTPNPTLGQHGDAHK